MATEELPLDPPAPRVPTAVFALGGVLITAVCVAAALHSLDVPLRLLVAIDAAVLAAAVIQKLEPLLGWSHMAIIVLSFATGLFATWTAILLLQNDSASGSALPNLQIDWPPKGWLVGEKLANVRGTVSGLPQGDVIWLMSQTVGENGAYLMGEPCAIDPTGHWTCKPIYFGTHEPNHQRYNILVRLLNGKTQQQAIEEWGNARSEHKNDLHYPTPIGKTLRTVEVQRYGPP